MERAARLVITPKDAYTYATVFLLVAGFIIFNCCSVLARETGFIFPTSVTVWAPTHPETENRPATYAITPYQQHKQAVSDVWAIPLQDGSRLFVGNSGSLRSTSEGQGDANPFSSVGPRVYGAGQYKETTVSIAGYTMLWETLSIMSMEGVGQLVFQEGTSLSMPLRIGVITLNLSTAHRLNNQIFSPDAAVGIKYSVPLGRVLKRLVQ